MTLQLPGCVPGTSDCVALTGSGDCAAAHAGWALETPVWHIGCCFRCTAPKKDWINAEMIAQAWKRNFVYQMIANHVYPWSHLPGNDENGRPWSERPPPKCPHCGVTVDAALMAKEKAEEAAASTIKALNNIRIKHAAGHAGGLRGRTPILPMDNCDRSRGLLHRRMNVASNCVLATFLMLGFDEKKRIEANAVLRKHKMMWRFRETAKARSKSISAGNDSRRLFSDPALVVSLLRIFYGEAAAEKHKAALDALAGEAEANVNVRSEEDAESGKEAAPKAAAARKRTGAQLQSAIQKRAPAAGKRGKKKAVAVVLAPGNARVDAATVADYTAARQKAAAAGPHQPEAAAETGEPSNASEPADTCDPHEKGDSSLDISQDDDTMEGAELEEDESAGGLDTAIDVWLKAIRYMAALHATYDDHFDMELRRAHATRCAETGRAWAISINEHTSNRALWQYVHDAFCHVEEDILMHGTGDRNDDSILEKGNRRKKRLGDRCVFRGGKNGHPASGRATYQQQRRVKQRNEHGVWTGGYLTKTVTRIANLGQAAQVLKLDLIAQLCEAQRKSCTDAQSAKQKEHQEAQKLLRHEKREATESAMMLYSLTVTEPRWTSSIAADLPAPVQKQVKELEAMTMAGYERNGPAFEKYLERRDLTVHTAMNADGDLYGFSISGWDTRSKLFLYELHVSKMVRKSGIGRVLVEQVAKCTCRAQQSKAAFLEIELNVHADNPAVGFYKKLGFEQKQVLKGGSILVMRAWRAA